MTQFAASGFATLVLGVGIVIAAAPQQKSSSSSAAETLMGAALHQEEVEGNLEAAVATYKQVISDARASRSLKATALLHLGRSYEKLGHAEQQETYERVVREFADQTESAATARTRLAAISSATAAQVGQTVRLLWSDLGRSRGSPDIGALSADGRYVSFATGEGDFGGSLGILDLKAGHVNAATRADLSEKAGWGDVDSSVISPDGRQAAYIWEVEAGDELRVIQVNGGRAGKSRSVFYHDGYMGVGGWSPDGKSVVVVRNVGGDKTETSQLAVISIADGAVRVLKKSFPAGGGTSGACFSPDGRYIAYQRRDGESQGPNDIFVMTTDGTEAKVVEDPGEDRSPAWSPDGSHIVFLSDRTGEMSLWMVPVAGGTAAGPPKLVKANVSPLLPLSIGRSGGLYYVAGNATSNVFTAELDANGTVAAKPSMATNQYLNSNRAGVWSPDGQYLAYVSVAPRGTFIRIRTVNTGEDREVPSQIQASGPVRWFPDGQSLLVALRDARILSGHVGYYRVNIESGIAELLHETTSRDLVSIRPDLSPDGKTIFYLETPGRPVRFDIDSRRETRLTPLSNSTPLWRQPLSLALSPDAAQIAYLGAEGVVVVPAAGGDPRELVRFSGASSPYERANGLGLAWSPDQQYLFFIKPDIRGIWRVPVTGGEPENIGVSMNRIRALRMHPDGRRIAFDSVVDAPSELWTLENFLPKTGTAR